MLPLARPLTRSPDEYRVLAVRLARHLAELAALRR
jgi:hypothetical protein